MPIECVGVVGLGYVGLSLATAFGRLIPTIGFDINPDRIRELHAGYDHTGETPPEALRAPHLTLADDPDALQHADFLIVTVPTPVDRAKRPDLSHLIDASRLVAHVLKARRQHPTPNTQHPIVVYESTVYPGCTEDVCIPVLERESGLKAQQDFSVGYSPERINPGDPERKLETIVKVVAAQDDGTAETVAKVYGLVVKAGVYKASDVRTAEAAKVIENIQRDLNIALMNELAMLFARLGLDIGEVLRAARTKWNFLPFEPGLVGGHCIPVDPYYLTHKAQEIGYHPEVILAGRRINDQMGVYVAQETVKLLIKAGKAVQGARLLVLGVTFKENVRDIRNSRVIDLIRHLESYGAEVEVHDPLVEDDQLRRVGLRLAPAPFRTQPNKHNKANHLDQPQYDALVLAVPHQTFLDRGADEYLALLRHEARPGVLVDVKGVLPCDIGEDQRVLRWSL